MAPHFLRQYAFLTLVDRLDGGQYPCVVALLPRGVKQGTHVLGKTGTAVAAAGVDEVVADTRVRSDAPANQLDVSPEVLSEVGDFVHERDLCRQQRVRGILGELRRADVHDDKPLVLALKRRIETTHHRHRTRIVGTDHDAIGLHEVVDRRAFLQKLRIGYDREGR